MSLYIVLLFASAAFGIARAYPYDLQKRNLHDVLKNTANEAETIGKTALKYFIPTTLKSGMAVVKPFLKRSVKRSVLNGPQQGLYPYALPYNNWINNNYARSIIGYPNNYNNWHSYGQYWQSNPYNNYWRSAYPRSIIPQPSFPQYGSPEYYPSNMETSTLHDGREETKTSLKNFENLISKVDSAFVSYSDDDGVTLNENLKSEENSKEASTEKSEKRSKSPKKMQQEGLKVITDTFTDFVCGENC